MSNSQRSNGKKKHGVTPRTLKRKMRAFAAEDRALFVDMVKFVDANCKSKSSAAKDKCLDEMCELVGKWVKHSLEIVNWCRRNGVDGPEFLCDVMNEEVS